MLISPKRSHSPFVVLVSFTTIIVTGILTSPAVVRAQGDTEQIHSSVANAPKIWEDRGPIQGLDLYWGSGSPERAPVGPFTFVAEDLAGTNPKAKVRDAKDVLWGVKWDEEVQAEVAASRLAWSMGLRVDETYYVDTGTIVFPGGQRPKFGRIGSYIGEQGNFTAAARFERIPEQKSRGTWLFDANPLMAEHGYAVLVLMNVIMANWDAKDSNTRILPVPEATGTTDWYMIGDYGACFGKMGGFTSHSKYSLKDFLKNPPVIKSVTGDTVYLDYKGRSASAHASVSLEGARFFANRAKELTLAQVEDAFRAANTNDAELRGFSRAVYDRIREVVTKVQ